MTDALHVFTFCLGIYCIVRGAWAVFGDLTAIFDTLVRKTRDARPSSRDDGLAQLDRTLREHAEQTKAEVRS